MRLMLAVTILILTTSVANAETIAGQASVIDGDTIEIHGQRIRLLDIDTPEARQLCQDQGGSITDAVRRPLYLFRIGSARKWSFALPPSWTATSGIWRTALCGERT